MISYEFYCEELDKRRRSRSATVIQCSECDNFVLVGQHTEQELIADGWLLEPVVYCPKCGEDDDKGGR